MDALNSIADRYVGCDAMKMTGLIRYVTLVFALVVAVNISVSPVMGEDAASDLSADQMLGWVRHNSSGQKMDSTGHLRTSSGKKVPFSMRMDQGEVSFSFTGPDETIALDLSGPRQVVRASDGGGAMKEVPSERFGKAIRGTDANFEDIALRFLYWSGASFETEEDGKRVVDSVATRDCFKIRANNPRREGPYAAVFAWVDKESGALMRVQGYDWSGKCVKQFEVISARKVDKVWVLKEMRIDRINPATGKVVARTWLYLDKNKKKPAPLF